MNERRRKGKAWAEGPLTPEQQDLAAKWLPFALQWAGQHTRKIPWARDDYRSAAGLACVVAARNFDPGRKLSFSTYLKWHLRAAHKELARESVPKGYRITGCLRHNPEALARRVPRVSPAGDTRDLGQLVYPDECAVDDVDELDAILAVLTPMERDSLTSWRHRGDFAARHQISEDFAAAKRALALAKARARAAELDADR